MLRLRVQSVDMDVTDATRPVDCCWVVRNSSPQLDLAMPGDDRRLFCARNMIKRTVDRRAKTSRKGSSIRKSFSIPDGSGRTVVKYRTGETVFSHRKLGLIDYNGQIVVHNSLRNVV